MISNHYLQLITQLHMIQQLILNVYNPFSFSMLVLMLMLTLVPEEAKEFHLGEFRAGMGALPSSDPYK